MLWQKIISGSGRKLRPRDKKNGEPGEKIIDISLNSDSAMETERGRPFHETYSASDNEKVRFCSLLN